MDRVRVHQRVIVGGIGLIAAIGLAWTAAAQKPTAHLVLEVIKGDDGDVMGYKVLHEEHKATWLAMLGRGSAGTWRCAMGDSDPLEIIEDDGPAAYFVGRDGEPCQLAVFAPDRSDGNVPRPPANIPSHPCPTCPAR